MAALFLLAMALTMFVGLSGLTFNLWRTGNLKWNRAISRDAKAIAGNGMLLAIAGSFFLFGADMVLSIWPYWTAAAAVVWLGYKGLDWLFIGAADEQPRVIQHANGRRAIVDPNRYRPLPPPPPGVGGGASDSATWNRQSRLPAQPVERSRSDSAAWDRRP